MQKKDYRFDLKQTSDEAGTFGGYLSVYNVVDLVNEMVMPGAFTKTISENPAVPMLWQHKSDEPIGQLTLKDTAEGLWVDGVFDLEVARAKEAYSLVKKKFIKGLSIGFNTIQKGKPEDGVTPLKELKLWEGSVVTFPCLPVAQISDVKSMQEQKDFLSELADAQTWAMRSMMLSALENSLWMATWDGNIDRAERIQQVTDSIDQFKDSYLSFLPAYLDLVGVKGTKAAEMDAPRMSVTSRMQAEEIVSQLQALLAKEAVDDETVDTSATEAAIKSNEPEPIHSWLNRGIAA